MAKVELERLSGKWVGEVSTRLDRSPATRKYGLLAPLCWPLWPRFGARRDFPDSLWKENSQKFAGTEFSEVRRRRILRSTGKGIWPGHLSHGGLSLSYRFISARSCSAASGGNIDKAAFIPRSERSRVASALCLPTAPTCTPKKVPTTVPTKLDTAPTTVATLVTSTHLDVAIRVIRKTRAKPVMMIQNPYLSLSRSISSEVGAGVVPCISTKGPILSASFTGVVALPTECREGDESAMNRRELVEMRAGACGEEFSASRAEAKTCSRQPAARGCTASECNLYSPNLVERLSGNSE